MLCCIIDTSYFCALGLHAAIAI